MGVTLERRNVDIVDHERSRDVSISDLLAECFIFARVPGTLTGGVGTCEALLLQALFRRILQQKVGTPACPPLCTGLPLYA